MSEARHHRFEIDIDEIERQLRRSVETAPSPKPDPLAELARIVGQDDPFRGILGGPRSGALPSAHAASDDPPPAGVSGAYDPVMDVYGTSDAALAADDLQPLRPRRSRGRLVAVVASLLVAVGATAGVLAWRNGGGQFSLAGAPPLIAADKTPLKVAPENPGGIDVPNQDRQVYVKGATEGQSRIVDAREQPLDVREAVRALPSPQPGAPAPSVSDAPGRSGALASSTAATAPLRNPAISALGEPRRVRTVAVRPDGSTYIPSGTATPAAAPPFGPGLAPGSSLPPPVPVTTMSIPVAPALGGPSPATPAVAPGPAATPPTSGASATPPSGPPPVTVLPPQRPRFDNRGTDAAPAIAVAQRFASADAVERAPVAENAPPAQKLFAVQIAVRPSEDEARAAHAQLSGRFATDLAGKPASFARAEVAGKTVYRVRVGPLSKDSANTLCTRLKSSGGQCFVATI